MAGAHLFWKKVKRGAESECWPWVGYKLKSGHGLTSHMSLPTLTSRKAWLLTHGQIENGLCVLHRCDNADCCNPAHLYLGTRADNMFDHFGKTPAAERAPRGRPFMLRPDQLEELYRMRRDGKKLKDCAAHFGVHVATVVRYVTAVRRQKFERLRSAKLSAITR